MASDEYFIKLGKSSAGPAKRERIEALWKAGKLLETAEVSPDKIHWETVKEFLKAGAEESEKDLISNFDDESENDSISTVKKGNSIGINDKLPEQIRKILLKNESVLNFEWLGSKGGCCSQNQSKSYFVITDLRCIIENSKSESDNILEGLVNIPFFSSKKTNVQKIHSLPLDKIGSFSMGGDETKQTSSFGGCGFGATSEAEYYLLIKMLDGSKISYRFLQPAKMRRIAVVLFDLIKKND